MEKLVCEKCGSDNVQSGQLSLDKGFYFWPDDKIRVQPKQGLACEICKDCGNIQNLRVTNPKNL